MSQQQVFEDVIDIIRPWARNRGAIREARPETSIVDDLRVESLRLIDVVIEIEDRFHVRVKEEEAGRISTLGDAVDLVLSKARMRRLG